MTLPKHSCAHRLPFLSFSIDRPLVPTSHHHQPLNQVLDRVLRMPFLYYPMQMNLMMTTATKFITRDPSHPLMPPRRLSKTRLLVRQHQRHLNLLNRRRRHYRMSRVSRNHHLKNHLIPLVSLRPKSRLHPTQKLMLLVVVHLKSHHLILPVHPQSLQTKKKSTSSKTFWIVDRWSLGPASSPCTTSCIGMGTQRRSGRGSP